MYKIIKCRSVQGQVHASEPININFPKLSTLLAFNLPHHRHL